MSTTAETWAAKSTMWLAGCAYRERWGEDSPVNIFYLDPTPKLAAQYHCDAHVVKMILETAQLLSTVWHVAAPARVTCDWALPQANGPVPEGELPYLHHRLGPHRIYRPTHTMHPCAHWARASRQNYDWLWQLGMWLLEEYEYRYGRKHATRPVLWALEQAPTLPDDGLTEPPLVMPESLKVVDEEGYWATVHSYRRYYVEAKAPLLHYTRRAPPAWLELTNGRPTLLA